MAKPLTCWERSIRHVDRRVKPTAWQPARGRLLKADVKRLRGLPSRCISGDLMMMKLDLLRRARGATGHEAVDRSKLDSAELRERLLERKRRERAAARRRAHPSVLDTRILIWKRRREWLNAAES